jgi:hypothetical protein
MFTMYLLDRVFLTNRLHYIPGYHNADTSINKPVYQGMNKPSDWEHSKWSMLLSNFIIYILCSPYIWIIFSFSQVDASVPYEEQAQRWAIRDKYIGKPNAKAINQYTDKYVSIERYLIYVPYSVNIITHLHRCLLYQRHNKDKNKFFPVTKPYLKYTHLPKIFFPSWGELDRLPVFILDNLCLNVWTELTKVL